MDGYCWTCGWHTDDLTSTAGLDPVTKMCAWCRAAWARRARPAGGDLGARTGRGDPEP